MELLLFLDHRGLFRVDIMAKPEESVEVHQLWEDVKPAVEEFQEIIKRLMIQRAEKPASEADNELDGD